MPYFDIIWDDEPGGNIEHIAEHDLTPDARYILVVYEQIDETTIYPVTAYDVEV